MYKYKVVVTGADAVGFSFAKNLVEVANLGGKLDETVTPRMSFPQQAVLFLASETELTSKAGIKYVPLGLEYSKEQLEEMSWDDFRTELRKVGIIGKDRKVMMDKYLSYIQEK